MGKGEQTRSTVVEMALGLASIHGLHGLSIGDLANRTGLSKSGLFAHFGSKEHLQQAVLEVAAERFVDQVVRPALKVPRGLTRLRALFDNWLEWLKGYERTGTGGCPILGAAFELDDQAGPLRDMLVRQQSEWIASLERMVDGAKLTGEVRADIDSAQVAFELQGIALSSHFAAHLVRDPLAEPRARAAFEGLLSRVAG